MIGGLMLSAAALPFSVKICHAGLIITLIAWATEGQWRCKLAILRRHFMLKILIALVAVQELGIFFAENRIDGWFSFEKKIFFLLIPLALATTAVKLSQGEIRRVFACFVVACFAGTVFCAFEAWLDANLYLSGGDQINSYLASSHYSELNPGQSPVWLFFSYVGLSRGIGIHPTFLSLYLAFCIVFLLHQLSLLESRRMKIVAGALIIYFSVFVVFLSSRIIILALALIYALLLVRTVAAGKRTVALALLTLMVVFAFLIFGNPVSRYRNLQEIDLSTFRIEPHREYKTAAHIRASLWWIAIKSLPSTNPVFGTGSSDVERVMQQTANHYGITNVLNSFDPHNQYLYTLLGSGFPGTLLLICCLVIPLYTGLVHKDHLLTAFAFLFLLLCMTESALELQKGIASYALFSALLFFQPYSVPDVALNTETVLRESHQ
jgi:hypothetical protein